MNLEVVDINKKEQFQDPSKEEPEGSMTYWPLRRMRGHSGIKIVNMTNGKNYVTTL